MRRLVLAVSLFTILFVVSHTSAQQANSSTVPNLIRYSGTVLQPRSAAVSSPIVGVTFAIYKQQEGGAPVWLETQNVTPDATGHYSVLLGSTTATGLPSDLFSLQEERWLGEQVQGQPEQSRVLLVGVPYAMKAAEADRLAGHSASEFVTTDNLQTAVQQQLQQQTPKGATSVIATGTTTNNGVTPIVTNPATNFVDNTTNQVVQVQQNGTGMGLTASSPSNVAILGTLNYIAKPGVVAGVEGTSAVNDGYGMFGYSAAASGGVGIHGRSDSLNGIGLQGWPIGTGGIAINATSSATSGSPIGLVARVTAPNGTGALILNVANTVTGPLIHREDWYDGRNPVPGRWQRECNRSGIAQRHAPDLDGGDGYGAAADRLNYPSAEPERQPAGRECGERLRSGDWLEQLHSEWNWAADRELQYQRHRLSQQL